MAGSHGSLTKAGKVRNQTPKVQGKERHSPIPRIRNRQNYIKRIKQAEQIDARGGRGRGRGRGRR
ncbi:MAG: 30S ribosomal protein S30e [Candidatus Hodarchaeota archaeon]